MHRRIARMSIAVAIGLGLLAGGILVLVKTVGDHETLYHGKPLFYWVEQCNSDDAATQAQARAIVQKEIIPALTEVMFHDTHDSSLRLMLVEKLNGLPGVTIYFIDAIGRRARAASNLGDFGPAARSAIPDLLRAVKGNDSAVQGAALEALGKIQSEPDQIVPFLISYLDDNNLNSEAAEALGYYGSLAKPAVPKLNALLKVPDKDLHHAVVGALKRINSEGTGQTNSRGLNTNQ